MLNSCKQKNTRVNAAAVQCRKDTFVFPLQFITATTWQQWKSEASKIKERKIVGEWMMTFNIYINISFSTFAIQMVGEDTCYYLLQFFSWFVIQIENGFSEIVVFFQLLLMCILCILRFSLSFIHLEKIGSHLQ